MEAVDFAKLALVLAALAAIVAVALYDVLYVWPLNRRLRRLEERCAELEDSRAAVGNLVGRLEAFESRSREQLAQLAERLAQFELANQSVPYEQAIGLAAKGEGAERLIDYLGLSQSEADLVRLLHGGRACAPPT